MNDLYATLLDTLPVAVFAKDALSGRFIIWNKSAERLFGISKEEALGKTDHDFFPKEQADFFRQKDLETVAGGVPIDIPEEPLDSHTLGHRILHTIKVPIAQGVGDGPVLLAVTEDVTERKHAGQDLQAEKDRFHAYLNLVGVIVIAIDADGRVTLINRRGCQVLGMAEADIVGRSYFETFVPERNRDLAWARFAKLMKGELEEVESFESSVQPRDGGERLVAWHNTILRDAAGRVIGTLSSGDDVTERKRIESELQAQKRLSESLLAVAEAIARQPTLEDTLRNALRVALELTGADSGSLFIVDHSRVVTHSVQDGGRVLPPLRDDVVRAVMENGFAGLVLKTQKPMLVDDTEQDERWLPLPDRLMGPHSAIGVPLLNGGSPLGVVTVQRSVPGHFTSAHLRFMEGAANQISLALRNALMFEEEQRLVQELRMAKDAAETANRTKSSFLANVSHELRTPLNAILGFTQLMSQESELTNSQRHQVRIIRRSGEHLLGLINDVLEMSKIEAGHTQLNPSSFDPGRLTEDVESMFRIRAGEKGLAFTVHCADSVPGIVKADERKLRQVLVNLVGNAIKFTRSGMVMVRSRSTPADADDAAMLWFEVEDSGPGIAPEDLEKVFEPFTQVARERGSAEGTGLGLAISRRFVRLMGGELSVRSELGRGACFTFSVRVELPQQSRQAAPPRSGTFSRRIGLKAGQPVRRVLVAEDNAENRRFLIDLLGDPESSRPSLELREATNGQEALDVFDEWSPDLICLDMRMPIMDGYEALRRLRARPGGRTVKIIALTASAFEEDRQQILAAGSDDFVRKPIQIAELYEKLARHLGMERLDGGSPLTVPGSATADIVAALTAMPESWRADMQRAAIVGNARQMTALIEVLQSSGAADGTCAAEALAELVYNYRHEDILELIENVSKSA